jgi:hypothetical protein
MRNKMPMNYRPFLTHSYITFKASFTGIKLVLYHKQTPSNESFATCFTHVWSTSNMCHNMRHVVYSILLWNTTCIRAISGVYYLSKQNETFKTNFTYVDLLLSMCTKVSHVIITSFERLRQTACLKRFSALYVRVGNSKCPHKAYKFHHTFHTWMVCHQCFPGVGLVLFTNYESFSAYVAQKWWIPYMYSCMNCNLLGLGTIFHTHMYKVSLQYEYQP